MMWAWFAFLCAAHLRGRRDAEPVKEELMKDPRDVFVPKCIGIVYVGSVELLPVSAIERVCEDDADGHAGCHAWADKLEQAFLENLESPDFGPDNFKDWCGGFYDWFHERFSHRCPDQCEKLACKPICAYNDRVAVIDGEEAELDERFMVVEKTDARILELASDSQELNGTARDAARTVVRASNALAAAQERQKDLGWELGNATALVGRREEALSAAEAARERAEDAQASNETAVVEAQHALQKSELTLKLANEAGGRARAALEAAQASAGDAASASRTLESEYKIQEAAHTEERNGIQEKAARIAKERRDIDRRQSRAKRAMADATAALEKNQARAEELQAGLMKPGQDLGTLAYFQKQLADVRAEEPLLKAAEAEATRTYEDLQIAERLVKDSEKAHRTEEREFAGSEKRLVKMKLKVGDAKAKAADLAAAENSTNDAYAQARAAADEAERAAANETAALAAAAAALEAAEDGVKSARATEAASEAALSDAKRDETSTWERLGEAKQKAAELETSMKSLVEEEAEARKAAALATKQMREEEEGIESLRANLTAARDALEERRKELGPPPASNRSSFVQDF